MLQPLPLAKGGGKEDMPLGKGEGTFGVLNKETEVSRSVPKSIKIALYGFPVDD